MEQTWNTGDSLSDMDSKRNKITCRAYDVDTNDEQKENGQKRGRKRIIVGTNGKYYYSNRYYERFIPTTPTIKTKKGKR